MPCTELGPAAQDVCAHGFSYASATEANTSTNTSISTDAAMDATSAVTAEASGAHKRTSSGRPKTSFDSHTTHCDSDAQANTDASSSAVTKANVAYGNDSKRIKSEGSARGPNKTGKTDVERLQLCAYLRQGVDRYSDVYVHRVILDILLLAWYTTLPQMDYLAVGIDLHVMVLLNL